MEGRKRKVKFDPFELEVLMNEAGKHLSVIKNRRMTLARRNAVWEEISEKVNAVGKKMRSLEEVKRRYQDFRRRTREKATGRKKRATGDRDQDDMSSTEEEEEEEQQEFTFEMEEVLGTTYDAVTIKEEHEIKPCSEEPPADPVDPEEPQNAAMGVTQELLREQRKQSAALQAIAREMRAGRSMARSARRDSLAMAKHCRQMLGAVSALTTAVGSISKVLEDGLREMNAIKAAKDSRETPVTTSTVIS